MTPWVGSDGGIRSRSLALHLPGSRLAVVRPTFGLSRVLDRVLENTAQMARDQTKRAVDFAVWTAYDGSEEVGIVCHI